MLYLLQMQKPECLDGFSQADPWPLLQISLAKGQGKLQPIAESNLLKKVSTCKPFARSVLHANPPCHCIWQACQILTADAEHG